MLNRLAYIFSLITISILLLTSYLLLQFSTQTSTVKPYLYMDTEADLIIEIQPSFFFREGLMKPLLNNTMDSIERKFFQLDNTLLPEQATGISYLNPVYITAKKENEIWSYAVVFSIHSATDFNVFAQNLNQNNRKIAALSNQHVGIIAYSTTKNQREQLNALELQLNSTHTNTALIDLLEKEDDSRPIRVLSLKNQQLVNLAEGKYNPKTHIFEANGTVDLSLPYLSAKIKPSPNGFYFSMALLPELKNSIEPYISAYFSPETFQRITGFELNYKGIEVTTTSTPTPIFDFHLHYDTTLSSSLNLEESFQNLPILFSENGKLEYMSAFSYNYTENRGLLSIFNTPFEHRSNSSNHFFAAHGNPSYLTTIEEPFSSIAFNLEPKLQLIHRFMNGMKDIQTEIVTDKNSCMIQHKISYPKHVNPIFELLYLIRNSSQ